MKNILIIWSTWYIWWKLFKELKKKSNYFVTGTSRNKNNIYLDLWKIESINYFNFSKYDIIINCSWLINYENNITWYLDNLNANLINNLNLLSKLDFKRQKLYHLSTLITNLPKKLHNSYSFSKKCFDEIILQLNVKNITIIKLPWIFWWDRRDWLIYNLKNNIKTWKEIHINNNFYLWHCMYLNRAINILITLLDKDINDNIINIWYSINTDVKNIIDIISKYYNKTPNLNKNKLINIWYNNFIPNIKIQNKYISLNESDFENDLLEFLQ